MRILENYKIDYENYSNRKYNNIYLKQKELQLKLSYKTEIRNLLNLKNNSDQGDLREDPGKERDNLVYRLD